MGFYYTYKLNNFHIRLVNQKGRWINWLKPKKRFPPKGLVTGLIILVVMSFIMFQVTDTLARQVFVQKFDSNGVVSFTHEIKSTDFSCKQEVLEINGLTALILNYSIDGKPHSVWSIEYPASQVKLVSLIEINGTNIPAIWSIPATNGTVTKLLAALKLFMR